MTQKSLENGHFYPLKTPGFSEKIPGDGEAENLQKPRGFGDGDPRGDITNRDYMAAAQVLFMW